MTVISNFSDRVKAILVNNSIDLSTVDFSGGDIRIQDIGNGPAIVFWNTGKLGAQPSNTTIAATTPYVSPIDQFNTALAQGVAIVSSGTPALNATYAVDNNAQQVISGIAAGIASRNRLPGGGATFDYPDMSGVDHAFSSTNFLNFAAAIEDYVYALSRGSTPATPLTIA